MKEWTIVASWRRAAGLFILLLLSLVVACTTATPTPDPIPTDTPSPTATPTSTPTPPPRPVTSPEGNTIDLDAVPALDMSKRSVPLEDVLFDNFNGSFTPLSEASPSQIRSLRDQIKPVYRAGYDDAHTLLWLLDRDLVIGYVAESGAYAYPIKILNYWELVNDVIDSLPLLISYCPLCGSGVVYSREVGGETLLFGNTSALYESDLVMYDHQTGSYWFQVLGEAIVGEMTGTRLKLLPSQTVTWGEWKSLHPNTRLLAFDDGQPFPPFEGSDPLGSYLIGIDRGDFVVPISEERLDKRLRPSEAVLTVEVGSAVKAYPLRLIGQGVVNDTLGGQPVAVFVYKKGVTGSAFMATVSGARLTFQFQDDRITDRETGSTWNGAGLAVSGPLQGTALEPVPTRRALWFSIAGAIPGLELYLP